jgi:hypothetical protein
MVDGCEGTTIGRNRMKRCLLGILALAAISAVAETRRAFIVGINTYLPPVGATDSGINLKGCENDADAMRQVLIARWGFDTQNVAMLKSERATRKAILDGLEKLVVDAQKGDVTLFYYSGHGSQMANTASDEYDGKDETIVPADRWLDVDDIRDKELAAIYQRIIAKGAQLVVIYDSCHSGSAARGLFDLGAAKSVEPLPKTVKDARRFDVAKMGALIISAAREFEPAREDPFKTPVRAAFSGALTQVLQSADINSSAASIFEAARALMKAEGKFPQEPVLECTGERRLKGFLGSTVGFSGKTRVAIMGIKDGVAKLQGGLAIGIRRDTELAGKGVRLKVQDSPTLTEASAKVISGNASSLKPGDFVEVEKWSAPNDAYLKVWIPTSNRAAAEVRKAAEQAAKLPPSMIAPEGSIASHVLSYDDAGWFLCDISSGQATLLGANLDDQAIARIPTASRIAIWLPAPKEMAKSLGLGVPGSTDNIAVVGNRAEAQYLLVGRPSNTGVEYAWVLQSSLFAHPVAKSLPAGQSTSAVPLESLPASTAWCEPTEDGIAMLADYAMRLARVRAWLTLPPPPDDGAFPYRVAFEPTDKTNYYRLLLVCDPERLKKGVRPKYVYVFDIDSTGASFLLAKRSDSPIPISGTKLESEIELDVIHFTPTYGIETFVLLVTDQPLQDPEGTLAFDGVTRSKDLPTDPLGRLLATTGLPTRSAASASSDCNWRLYRLTVKSSENGLIYDTTKGLPPARGNPPPGANQ